MGSLKSRRRTFYWSSLVTIVLESQFFFNKPRFSSDRRTNEQTIRRTSPSRKAPLALRVAGA